MQFPERSPLNCSLVSYGSWGHLGASSPPCSLFHQELISSPHSWGEGDSGLELWPWDLPESIQVTPGRKFLPRTPGEHRGNTIKDPGTPPRGMGAPEISPRPGQENKPDGKVEGRWEKTLRVQGSSAAIDAQNREQNSELQSTKKGRACTLHSLSRKTHCTQKVQNSLLRTNH